MNTEETILDDSFEKSEEVVYATFWQRVGASFLDGLILSPISIGLTFYSLIYLKSFVLGLLPSLITLLYKVWMEQHYGATLGKQIVGIRVADYSFQNINFPQSFTRNYFYLFSLILALFQHIDMYSIEAFQSADTFFKIVEVQKSQSPLLSGVNTTFSMLFLIDCLFVLNDDQKRTFHDRWARTIVIKK